jgi:hypothetical protein
MHRWLKSIAALLFLCIPSAARCQTPWTWTDTNGDTRTQADLAKILADHKLWVESNNTRGTQADFSNANLRGAHLESAILDGADLTSANLSGAHLGGASLRNAQLSDGSDAACPAPTGERADGTDLTDADLTDANLTGANLTRAKLARANLYDVTLDSADFSCADVQGAVFEPTSFPDITTIANAQNMESLTYSVDGNSQPLYELRSHFEDGGFETPGKQITCAMNRRATQSDGRAERYFRTVLFDWTCKYGSDPGFDLQIWLVILLLCCLVYAAAIHSSSASGIYKVQTQPGQPDGVKTEIQIRSSPIAPAPLWSYVDRELRVFFWAGYFSLISAFNIGFPEINLGNWLQHLPRSEYRLKAKGWPRTVAGIQSLVSLGLLALWLASYFGHPFE